MYTTGLIPDPTHELGACAAELHEPFLERAADSEGSQDSGWALGAFLTLRVVDQLASSDADPESISYQIQATLKYLQELDPQSAEVGHLDNVARAAEVSYRTTDARLLWSPLSAFATWLERSLHLSEALDVLNTMLRVCEGRDDTAAISTYLHRGRVLRLAGRLNEASASYAAAGDLALWQGDTHSELLSRIGRGIVLQKLGNLPAAARLFTDVLADARRGGDQDAQARASHDLAVTLHRQNRTAQAVGFAFQAYRLYEERENKQRALSDVGMILQALGHYSAARDAYELVLAQDIPVGMRINTKLELLELEAVTQNRVAFERRRRELAMIGAELPPDAQVDFEIKLGGGLASFGERRQARRHLQKAVQHAEEYRLNDYLFRAETALRELDNDHDSATPPAPAEVPAWDEHYPEVGAVAEQLHALRAGG